MQVQRIYLVLALGESLASSFIWGINTLFLLDAGLTNLEAFAANAFFTAGMVVFEVPTGVVADTWGRRASYLLGTVTLAAATFLYWIMWRVHAPFAPWAACSMLLGLGFTFFSGAVEAWLIDALEHEHASDARDVVLGRGQMVSGAGMLVGSLAGGVIAHATNLGVPFLVRTGVLVLLFGVAAALMKDVGFVPEPAAHPLRAMRAVWRGSIDYGLAVRPVRWLMIASPFAAGAGVYAFYAAQPYLLQLSGDREAYGIAGLAAALVAGTQILGGWLAPKIRARFAKRTSVLLLCAVLGDAALVLFGLVSSLWPAVMLLAAWGFVFAAQGPVRQAYINEMIPSKQRATILSFDSLMGNAGGVVSQPALGRAADVYGYAASLVASGIFSALAIPFLLASRRERSPADTS